MTFHAPTTCAPMIRALTLILLIAAPARAQEGLAPDRFLDLAEGRTLTFVDAMSGALVGRERFLPGGRTIYVRADGTCAHGAVTVRGPELCFDYDDEPPGTPSHCWWPIREDSGLSVRLADSGVPGAQDVTAVTDEPLACEGTPVG